MLGQEIISRLSKMQLSKDTGGTQPMLRISQTQISFGHLGGKRGTLSI